MILIVLVVLLLIPAMQVAVVQFRVKGFASHGSIAVFSRVFYVYVLRSQSDSGFYIGFSTNLRARLRQHQNGASFATKSCGPWKLIYYEAYLNQEDALGRERYLKSGSGRRFLKAQLRHYLVREPLARPRGPAA
ncbi:MAG TPA: GIY-YIG nuclease family protein [Chthoniobacterales bacterium]|nr:GIY-YIG nuclease family protein [Chthoniobacterales bacterium]